MWEAGAQIVDAFRQLLVGIGIAALRLQRKQVRPCVRLRPARPPSRALRETTTTTSADPPMTCALG